MESAVGLQSAKEAPESEVPAAQQAVFTATATTGAPPRAKKVVSLKRSAKQQPRPETLHNGDTSNVMVVTPTVLSIDAAIMRRFERARETAASHTAVVLDALRATAHDLPTLVRNGRPAQRPDDLFPWRASPGQSRTTRPEQLRIRPTVGEIRVIDDLVETVNTEINSHQPGVGRASRSEVIAAALNTYLPKTI